MQVWKLSVWLTQRAELANNPGAEKDKRPESDKLIKKLQEKLKGQELRTSPMVEAELLNLRRQLDKAKAQLAVLHKMQAEINAVEGQSDGGKAMQHTKDKARILELKQSLQEEMSKRPKGDATRKATKRDCEMAFQELDDIKYNQLIPAVMDDTRASFQQRWQQLCDRIATWAQVGYHYTPGNGEMPSDYFAPMGEHDEGLMCIYAREISVRLPDFIRLYNSRSRHLVIQGLVHRILHEEVFEGVKKFLKFELSDPAVSWMDKQQPSVGWKGSKDDLYNGRNRAPSSWRTRKWERLMGENLGDVNTVAFDPAKTGEADPQTKERLQANSAEEREKQKALRYNIISDMDTRFQQSFDLKAFHLNRARMMKTIFQLVEDPMRPDMLRWRTAVLRLIFDTVEPARITNDKLIRRSALKYELWKIIKDALDLAVSMQCQRKCWYTRMKPPVDDYQFDSRAMVDVREDPWQGQDREGLEILDRARELSQVPWEHFSIGKVWLAVTPALFVRGEDDDYSIETEVMVVPAGVVPKIGPFPLCSALWFVPTRL